MEGLPLAMNDCNSSNTEALVERAVMGEWRAAWEDAGILFQEVPYVVRR
jgi:hypothetical protein